MADEPKPPFVLPEADANTIFGKPTTTSMRPVVSMREPLNPSPKVRAFNDHLQTPKPKAAQLNPFNELQDASIANEQLVERLYTLCAKLAGAAPEFAPPAGEGSPGALLPLAARVAQLIRDRSNHGISLIDKIEEYLGE